MQNARASKMQGEERVVSWVYYKDKKSKMVLREIPSEPLLEIIRMRPFGA
jgi:uncharacterized FlaG/YvyC family protein